jgi:hypothetical protein
MPLYPHVVKQHAVVALSYRALLRCPRGFARATIFGSRGNRGGFGNVCLSAALAPPLGLLSTFGKSSGICGNWIRFRRDALTDRRRATIR